MKKFIGFLTVLALLAIPVSAMAVKAGDWELVGYTKLEAFWDSAQVNKNLSGPLLRTNAAVPNNWGRFRMTAQSTRFGLKVNGPDVLGAKTQGYIELDFDSNQDGRQSASNSYIPRMRHAWFRMDWPGGWQLLMGQYWGVFCDFYPETVNDGPFQNHGQATQRIPQIRMTYKTGPWTFSGLAGVAYDPAGDNVTGAVNNLAGGSVILSGSQSAAANTGALWGQFSTMPQFQGQVIFEKDLYGKAAFAGRPRGFVADFGAGIQNLTYEGGQLNGAVTYGQNAFQGIGGRGLVQNQNQVLTPWVVQGTLFIPILVTHNNNLAGTASMTLQGHIGQGFSFFGNGTDGENSFFKYDAPTYIGFSSVGAGPNFFRNVNYVQAVNYRRYLTPKYGGYLQGQYYFTNEWYASAVYGFDKAYGVGQGRNFGINPGGVQGNLNTSQDPNNIQNYTYASMVDQSSFTQEIQGNLFFTPSKNLKFGLGYSFMQTKYFQITTIGSKASQDGYNHSVRFAGWFFF
jgi:hypothetical protein